MPDSSDEAGIILDPSFLFSEEGLAWVTDSELLSSVHVSAALYDRIRDPELALALVQEGLVSDPDRIGQLQREFEAIQRFSYASVDNLPPAALSVCEALLSNEPVLGEIFADEWAFLTSQSLIIGGARAARTIAAFEAAGGHVFQASREQMERGLAAIRGRIPAPVRRVMKAVGRVVSSRTVTVILIGANAVPLFVPAAGLPVWLISSALEGDWVIAGDP